MKNLILVFVLLITSSLFAQKKSEDLNQTIMDVVFLSSDYMEGRYTGSPAEVRAAEFVKNRFEEAGLQAAGTDGTWFQSFSFKLSKPHSTEDTGVILNGKNVIGIIDNKAPYTVVIGAHYDHLGYGESGAQDANDKTIHNGADDNASGVAALFYLAKKLQDKKYSSHNYMFISFSGEEEGLHGSKAYVKDPTLNLAKIDYMINLDMVGRLNSKDKPLMIYGVGTSPSWKPAMENVTIAGIDKIKTSEEGVGPTDHTSFYLKDIPVLHFFTGQHSDYHRSTDDSQLINFEGINLISDYILAVVSNLNSQEKLVFTKTKAVEKKRAKYKVTLGVMPDYSSEKEGLQIDAVMGGRPADNAGIIDGDLVVEMDGKKIKDIYAYMEILAAHNEGDTISVKVMRDGEIKEFSVTF